MNYVRISEGQPLLPGMYIVVHKLKNYTGKQYKVHALRNFENGKWSPDDLDTSTIIAYAGPIERYEEENHG